MKINKLNIIVILAAFSALAGCSTTHLSAYSHDEPIISAADARAMIRVEVRAVEPEAPEQELVAAVD